MGIHKLGDKKMAIINFYPMELPDFRPGQKVPTRITKVSFEPTQKMILMNGIPLACETVFPVHYVRGSLGPKDKDKLSPIYTEIINEMEKRKMLVQDKRRDLWFFEALLYAYRFETREPNAADQSIPAWENGPTWDGPPDHAGNLGHSIAHTESLLKYLHDLIENDSTIDMTGLWYRDRAIYRSSPLVSRIPLTSEDQAPPRPEGMSTIISSTPSVLCAFYLQNILDFLTCSREMVETYDTEELRKSHGNIWNAMIKKQLT